MLDWKTEAKEEGPRPYKKTKQEKWENHGTRHSVSVKPAGPDNLSTCREEPGMKESPQGWQGTKLGPEEWLCCFIREKRERFVWHREKGTQPHVSAAVLKHAGLHWERNWNTEGQGNSISQGNQPHQKERLYKRGLVHYKSVRHSLRLKQNILSFRDAFQYPQWSSWIFSRTICIKYNSEEFTFLWCTEK